MYITLYVVPRAVFYMFGKTIHQYVFDEHFEKDVYKFSFDHPLICPSWEPGQKLVEYTYVLALA